MNTENILVPFYRNSSDLESLYHSFALAERIRAKIYVLFFKSAGSSTDTVTAPIESACLKIVRDACEEGLPVSFHLADDQFETELIDFIEAEHIGLIVVSPKDEQMRMALKHVKSKISAQVIEVEKKHHINPKQKKVT